VATSTRLQTLPYDWYTDPAVLRLERDRLFSRFWQYATRAAHVAEPGQFATAMVGETPVVLVRGRDGELRGFVNVCRHRGFVLCEGDGQRETIQCPYHAWTYDLDGALRSAPRAESEPSFEKESLGLHPVSVAEWGPFVFANLDPDAAPVEEWLGDVPERLAEHGVDLGRMSFYRRFEVDEYAANWKVCAENFLECYHCAIAHPSLAKAIDVSQDAYALTTGRWHSLQVGPPKNGGGGIYDAIGEVDRGIFAFLFPNTVLNAMPGKLNLSIGPILPRGPEQTFRFFDYYLGPETDETWLADFLALETQVGVEDRELVERVQRGLRNGIVGSGNLMPESEKLIGHFQSLVAEELGADR
jgi:phenylpropionate dioxygenase-like ring-hydroxylating dioxygenase large terminal subunit